MRGSGPRIARTGRRGGVRNPFRDPVAGEGSNRRRGEARRVKRQGGFGQNTRHPVAEALRGKGKDKFM